jgi:hypothetical protein
LQIKLFLAKSRAKSVYSSQCIHKGVSEREINRYISYEAQKGGGGRYTRQRGEWGLLQATAFVKIAAWFASEQSVTGKPLPPMREVEGNPAFPLEATSHGMGLHASSTQESTPTRYSVTSFFSINFTQTAEDAPVVELQAVF